MPQRVRGRGRHVIIDLHIACPALGPLSLLSLSCLDEKIGGSVRVRNDHVRL